MDMRTALLFEIFRDALGTASFPEEHLSLLTEEAVRALYGVAKSHDLSQILADFLDKRKLLTENEISQKLIKQQLLAVYRYERLEAAYKKICAALEEAQIHYLPLKGSVIRPLYPTPYYRTSCDIDILVREEVIETAISILSAAFPLEKEPETAFHDVSLYFKGGIHLELHFSILENDPEMDKVLSRVWEYTAPAEEGAHRLVMTNEFFLFHQITHAAYHFKMGGCGIRPFMDVFLILQKTTHDEAILRTLLDEAGLTDFYRHFVALSRVWFLGEAHTDVTSKMENYLLGAGVYGSLENQASTAAAKKSRFRYLIRRIFPSLHSLSNVYPRLAKYPVLYPFYAVKRWFRVFNGKKRKRAINEIKVSMALTTEQKDGITALFDALGLQKQKG